MEDYVDAYIEVPRGGRNKYEYDQSRGVLRLNRVLYSSVHYPADYGFIVDTLAEDGDHLDILVIVEEANYPGVIVPARPIGVLDMVDEKGPDQKVLGVPVGDPRFDSIHNISDISSHWLIEIKNFFDTYKALQQLPTVVRAWHRADVAWRIIEECRERYQREAGAAA